MARREAYAGPDTYQTSTITKQISLSGQPLGDGRMALTFDTSPPVLTKPRELESMETMALRLAALYEQVVVEAAPPAAWRRCSTTPGCSRRGSGWPKACATPPRPRTKLPPR